MAPRLLELRERLYRGIPDEVKSLREAAEADDREFTEEEDQKIAALLDEKTSLLQKIERIEALADLETVPAADVVLTGAPETAHPRITSNDQSTGPFRGPHALGEQLVAIAAAGMPGGKVDPRLHKVMELEAAASGGSANVGSDGGFLIQRDTATDLMKESLSSADLASRCSETEVGPNSDGLEVIYTDETSRATGSRWGGVQIYRVEEAGTVADKKPKMGTWERRLRDLMGLAYATERLLQDAPAVQSWYREAFEDEFAFVIDDEIYRGDGVGQCLGILNSDALVTVAKESGQVNDTIVAENVQKIWSRTLPRSKARGVWVTNTECFPQLQTMQIGTGASGQLVYMPPGGISGAPYGSIYGRPVLDIEHASALGDVGDLAFLDLSQYKLIRKGGIQSADSIHVRFLNNERAFRWVARINGAPKLKKAITPYKGSGTLSHFVTLAAR